MKDRILFSHVAPARIALDELHFARRGPQENARRPLRRRVAALAVDWQLRRRDSRAAESTAVRILAKQLENAIAHRAVTVQVAVPPH